MKQVLLLLFMLTASVSFVWAQRQISGTVTDADAGSALPGVNVLVKGTTTGTVTDIDGNYSISVSKDNPTLTFSFLGYTTQEIEVGNRSTIDLALEPDVRQLSEVVVTALGVERETRALQYSITEVDGENLTQAREISVANSLAGRVAGVNVSNIASGPAGSSRVVIRGNKSLQGNNQPLYVIDGIPMDNSNFGQAGMWGGRDGGDGMSSINPDDIASITVLKGASAAALYGARAANGVINIVTKNGSARKGIGVEFNSNFVFEQINDQRDFQREYGQGNYVASDPSDPKSTRIAVAPRTQQEGYDWGSTSWGPRLGSVANSVHFDGVTRPYTDAGDNWDRYFKTGSTLTNTIALSGGSETQNFRFSFSNLRNESVLPETGFNRQNVSLSVNSKFGKKLTFTSRVLYSHEFADNRPLISQLGNGMLWMYHIPANSNVLDYYGDSNKPGAIPPGTDETSLAIWGKRVGQEYQPSRRGQNPWWTAYQYDNDDTRDRVLPSATLRYDITDFLWVQGRAGMDWYTRRETDLLPEGTGYQPGGVMKEFEYRVREINMEWMLGYDQAFGKFNINAFVGGNRMRRDNEMTLIRGNNFNVPFFAAITNTVLQRYEYNFSQSGINSLFGSAEVSYNNLLFLTGTVRNDWFSVLNPEFNSILYPSIGGSFVFSDALKTLPNWLSFGKVRASWAQVGNVTVDPYNTILTYSLKQPHVGIPLASFSTARGVSGSIPNPILQPLTSTEFEVGLDIRFFDNRLGLDFTYYNQETTDDILKAGISGASGFGTTVLNVGKIENRGIEALLTATPVSGPLTWDISFNFAKNTNKVVSLIEGIDELIVARPRTNTVFVKHIVGQPFGVLTGLVQKRSPDGQLVFDPNNGAPIQSDEYEIIGNSVPDWTGGINNSFTFKGFNLGALVDFKIGGDIYSGTNVWMTQAGFHKQTIQGREGQEPITVSGVAQNGTDVNGDPTYEPFSRTLTPSEAQNYWSQMGNRVQDHFLYDASFAKLRQVTFGYIFPSSMLSKTPFRTLSLSFVARNLAILYNNVENIDPESSYQNGNGQGLDFFGMPQTRSYGFNLKVQF